jgi:CelD/BcsL family acetyltransferase involved in cellulose biosynthesis
MLLTSTAPTHHVAPGGVTTRIITDDHGFAELAGEWNALVDMTASPEPFQTWEWMYAWWLHLRGTAALHLITVRADDRLIAIAPLVLRPRRLAASPHLEFLGAGRAGADYLDVLAHRDHAGAAVTAIAARLASLQLPVYLDHLPPASVAADVEAALVSAGWSAIASSPDVCPLVDLAGHTWDTYLGSLGASHRANFRRRLRGLQSRFDVRLELAATDGDRRAALTALSHFHQERWRADAGSTAFGDAALRRFHDDFVRAAGDAGWLRLYVLSLSGLTAAVLYGFRYRQRFYFYQHGFDAAFTSDSLGLVLMGLSIRAAIEDGAAEFDMLYGHEPYKYLWARGERSLARFRLFPPHLGGTILRRQVQARRALRNLACHVGLKRP